MLEFNKSGLKTDITPEEVSTEIGVSGLYYRIQSELANYCRFYHDTPEFVLKAAQKSVGSEFNINHFLVVDGLQEFQNYLWDRPKAGLLQAAELGLINIRAQSFEELWFMPWPRKETKDAR